MDVDEATDDESDSDGREDVRSLFFVACCGVDVVMSTGLAVKHDGGRGDCPGS